MSSGIFPYREPHQEPWRHKLPEPKQLDPFALLRPMLKSWTVGFDQQFELLQELQKNSKLSAYPPYNIKEVEEDTKYEIEMAIAGFAKEDITISVKENSLVVEGGSKKTKDESYVHKGIAARTFTQSFVLGDYVEVTNAKLENGILTISLDRKVPEEKKPKTIKIK